MRAHVAPWLEELCIALMVDGPTSCSRLTKPSIPPRFIECPAKLNNEDLIDVLEDEPSSTARKLAAKPDVPIQL
ncbi:hypothetical protein KIN20_012036 [Parelaphostrongylus tenuis]|uniref:Uncharacterized protein n=1 Tax=Parelaphostrongylus tenuis TaxID=148309 RepID=A0AAD5QMK6_PARTN|nr:hypothetical protein KIN20_012036 [Parelaphostrongylus tenuis]